VSAAWAVAWEAARVRSELGQHHLGGQPPDARDRLQQLKLRLERAQPLLDLRRQRSDRLVEVVDVGEQVRDEQRVVAREAALERLPQRRQL
jgi:hypothetical protein